MISKLQNEKGITLVELLAVIVIAGIAMVLIMSIIGNGQRQYSNQSANAEQLNDLRYVAKVITKEIRKADRVEVFSDKLILGKESQVVFTFTNGEVFQNGSLLATDIEELSFEPPKDRLMRITIVGTKENSRNQDVKTEIFIREGVIIE